MYSASNDINCHISRPVISENQNTPKHLHIQDVKKEYALLNKMIYSCFWLWIREAYHTIIQNWCILSTYIIIRCIFHDCTLNAMHLKVLAIHIHTQGQGNFLLLLTNSQQPVHCQLWGGYEKIFCRNIFSFSTDIFFQSFCSGVTCVNFVLQMTPEERLTRTEIRWTWWPNSTIDNCVLKNIRQNLHRHMCSVSGCWVFLKPAIQSIFVS